MTFAGHDFPADDGYGPTAAYGPSRCVWIGAAAATTDDIKVWSVPVVIRQRACPVPCSSRGSVVERRLARRRTRLWRVCAEDATPAHASGRRPAPGPWVAGPSCRLRRDGGTDVATYYTCGGSPAGQAPRLGRAGVGVLTPGVQRGRMDQRGLGVGCLMRRPESDTPPC
jgi:hypothetical protein